MEKGPVRHHNNNTSNGNTTNTSRERTGTVAEGSSLLRASSEAIRRTTSSDFVLQWGNRKRLRCMKVQVKDKDVDPSAPVLRTTVRVDRRVVRADKDSLLHNHQIGSNHANHCNNGYLNLRQRPSSPQPPPPPPPHRILRNSESSGAMRGQSNGGGVGGIASPERAGDNKLGSSNENNKSGGTSDSKKGGSPSGSGEGAAANAVPPPVWPPKFVIALTNKEKEEDFMALKGSKLPQRPKKRAKIIQRTVNLVSPGGWLCDLTLERYEVREKKASKKVDKQKRPRGLKAIGNMESDSE